MVSVAGSAAMPTGVDPRGVVAGTWMVAGVCPQPVLWVALQVAALNTEIRLGPWAAMVATYKVPVVGLTARSSGLPPGTCKVGRCAQPAVWLALQVRVLST